jgi:hypothetical protein
VAEAFRVDILLLRFQEASEKELELVKHVFVLINCRGIVRDL